MDGARVIEDLMSGGFKPESRKEENLVQNLKDKGFVFYEKQSGLFKMKDGVVKTENYDEIVLECWPVLRAVNLYSVNNNFSPSLDIKINEPRVLVRFVSTISELKKVLGSHKLGEMVDATVVAYASNGKNEGFKVEFEHDTVEDLGLKWKDAVMTTSLSRGAKASDTKNLEFKGVRPTKLKLKIGVDTSFGTVFDEQKLKSAGEKIVLDKALFYN